MNVRRGAGLRRTWLIVVRELRERVTQRAYRIAIVVVMAVAALGVALPALIGDDSDAGGQTVLVAAGAPASGGSGTAGVAPSATGASAVAQLQRAAETIEGPAAPRFRAARSSNALRAAVREGDAPIGVEVPGSDGATRLVVREDGGGDLSLRLQRIIDRAVLQQRADDLAPRAAAELTRFASTHVEVVTGGGLSNAGAPVVMVLALFVYLGGLILMTGYASGLVADRATRLSERLLTAARPVEHLAGKLIGTWIAGVLQLGAAIGVALITSRIVSGSGAASPLGEVPVEVLVYFPVAFIGSYLLYASLATVLVLPARKTEDVGGLLGAATTLQIVAFVLTSSILTPGATISSELAALSLVPFFAPMMMLGRFAAGDVPAWEAVVGVTGPFLLAAVILWFAAPAYARHAIDAPGGRGIGAALRALRR